MERALVFRPDPDLVAEVAREGEAADERRDRTDIHPPEGEEGKGRDRNVVGRDLLKEGPGVRPGDREADEGGAERPDADAALRRQVLLEPAPMVLLRVAGAEDHEPVLGEPAQEIGRASGRERG